MGESVDELNITILDEPAETAVEPEKTESKQQDTDTAAPPPAPAEQPDSTAPEEDEKQKAIAKYAYEARVADRKAKELEKRLQELEAKSTQTARPEVPPLPDPLAMTDQQFREYQAERDQRVAEAAQWDAQQNLRKQEQQRLEQERQTQQAEALRDQAKTYTARAVQLGIKAEELQQAGQVVGAFIQNPDIASLILKDDHGPLITKYLAQNIAEMDELNRLPPLEAAIRIATQVKPKAAALKPRVSTAPDPIQPAGGGNVPHKDYGLEGATYL